MSEIDRPIEITATVAGALIENGWQYQQNIPEEGIEFTLITDLVPEAQRQIVLKEMVPVQYPEMDDVSYWELALAVDRSVSTLCVARCWRHLSEMHRPRCTVIAIPVYDADKNLTGFVFHLEETEKALSPRQTALKRHLMIHGAEEEQVIKREPILDHNHWMQAKSDQLAVVDGVKVRYTRLPLSLILPNEPVLEVTGNPSVEEVLAAIAIYKSCILSPADIVVEAMELIPIQPGESISVAIVAKRVSPVFSGCAMVRLYNKG